jgi:hypothetical protein
VTVTVKGAAETPGVTEVGETVHIDMLGAPVQARPRAEKRMGAVTPTPTTGAPPRVASNRISAVIGDQS